LTTPFDSSERTSAIYQQQSTDPSAPTPIDSNSTMAAASAKASINFRIHLTSLAAQTGASPGIRVKAKERVQLTTTPEACKQSLEARVRGVDASASIGGRSVKHPVAAVICVTACPC
jgi:hypothetical protein